MSKWMNNHFEWCMRGLDDENFKKTDFFKNKKREFKKRGVLLICLSIALFLFSSSIPVINFIPGLLILATISIILTAGILELITGLLGFPPVSL